MRRFTREGDGRLVVNSLIEARVWQSAVPFMAAGLQKLIEQTLSCSKRAPGMDYLHRVHLATSATRYSASLSLFL